MSVLTIPVADEKLQAIRVEAAHAGVAVEELVMRGVDEYLERKRLIRASSDRVLAENAELYRRLAQ